MLTVIRNVSVQLHAAATRFLRDEQGLTTVEYAIAGGLVGAAVIVAFILLGGNVGIVIDGIANQLVPE